jgi:hypothetical protein
MGINRRSWGRMNWRRRPFETVPILGTNCLRDTTVTDRVAATPQAVLGTNLTPRKELTARETARRESEEG